MDIINADEYDYFKHFGDPQKVQFIQLDNIKLFL